METFTLAIGPAVYEVSDVQDLKADEGHKIDGEIMHGAETLQVEASTPYRTKRVTVVHEVLHAILQQAGHYKWYKNEGLLDALAYGMVGAKLNPGAVTGRGVALLESLFDVMEAGNEQESG